MENEVCLAIASSCDWAAGLAFSVVAGGIVTGLVVSGLRWLARVWEWNGWRLEASTAVKACVERLAITLIAVYNFEAAAAFAVVWMGLVYATYWNRPNRTLSADDEEIRRWARRSHTALLGYLLSAMFALGGALIVCG